MRFTLARMLAVVGLAGCGGHGGHTERIGPAKDTVVTPRQTQDTTIVTTDTTVKVETMVRKGRKPSHRIAGSRPLTVGGARQSCAKNRSGGHPLLDTKWGDSGLELRLTAVWRAVLGQRLGADQA